MLYWVFCLFCDYTYCCANQGHYKWRSRQDGGDAHLSDGDRLATLDVFPLMGIDLFKVSTRVCVSTHSLIMYVLHSVRNAETEANLKQRRSSKFIMYFVV